VARLADPHQHLAVAGDHHHRQLGLRQCQSKADHHGPAHGAPEIEIAVVIAGSGDVVGGGSQSADRDRTFAIGEKAGDDSAAVEKVCFAHFTKTFVPIRRCDNSTAVGVQAL